MLLKMWKVFVYNIILNLLWTHYNIHVSAVKDFWQIYENMLQYPFCLIPEGRKKRKDEISDVYLGSQFIGMLPQTRKKLYIWKIPN